MSRIVLTRYPDGDARIVVGYDHAGFVGCFYQEFNQDPADGNYEGWEEVLRGGDGIPLDHFRARVPEDLQPLITDQVIELLYDHMADPDSGYGTATIDLAR